MACGDQTKRIVSITHGATALASPHGGNWSEQNTVGESRPGTRKSPCAYLDTYGLRAFGRFGEHVTPITRGTVASLVYVLQDIDETGNVTVTLATMMMLNASGDYDGRPQHSQQYEFTLDAGDSENIAPITVS